MGQFTNKPSEVKAAVPTTGGNFCDKFVRAITQIPQFFYNFLNDIMGEDGKPNTNFKEMICALGCAGTGSGDEDNPDMPAPSNILATDDSYSDKIAISWDAVTPPAGVDDVTEYWVYRSIGTNSDPSEATLIATVTAPTLTVDDPVDSDLVAGTNYRYWVRATNGSETSGFSTSDLGRAASLTGSMSAVSDLRASFGFNETYISLVWTPPAGATKYDVYRNTSNDFATASKIYSNVSPASTTLIAHPTGSPTFWDNVGEVVLYDQPPTETADYYYWVVAKKDSPSAVSSESNDALGRVKPPAIYNQSTTTLSYSSTSYVVPGGITKIWMVLFGGGGGGAGGNNVYGGGGGGGAAVVQEAFTVAPGDTIDLVLTGPTPDTGNASSEANGSDGTVAELQINGVTKMTANAGKGGEFSASGGGLGGIGDTGSGTASPTIYDGMPGLDASGSSGGRSGYSFGRRRIPMADALGTWGGDGSNGSPGAGAKAVAVSASLSVGGHGTPGRAVITTGT